MTAKIVSNIKNKSFLKINYKTLSLHKRIKFFKVHKSIYLMWVVLRAFINYMAPNFHWNIEQNHVDTVLDTDNVILLYALYQK